MDRSHTRVGELPPKNNVSSEKGISYWMRLFPIIFFITYLNITVFLFAYGPWSWPVEDGLKLYIFLTLAHLALLSGYLTAAFGKSRKYHGTISIDQLLYLSLFINLFLLLPTSLSRSGSLIPNISSAVNDLGAAYMDSNEMRMEVGGGIAEYIRIVLSPIIFLLTPLTFFYWERYGVTTKLFAFISIFGFLAIYISIGTNKALADFVLLIPSVIIARYFAGKGNFRWKRIVLFLLLVVLVFSLFFQFFSSAVASRTGSDENALTFAEVKMQADSDNYLIKFLPQEVKVGAIVLISYVTQGYYAVYLSLDEPFVPMFGIGNSRFLTYNASKITGIQDLDQMTYPGRIEGAGWDSSVRWATIYPWIASDVSFPGTLLIVFLIGRLFAMSWLDTLDGKNPFAVAIFAQFIILLFYFPANNQVMQSGEGVFAFFGLLIFWLYTRKH